MTCGATEGGEGQQSTGGAKEKLQRGHGCEGEWVHV